MPPQIAAIGFAGGIAGLLWLNRDHTAPTSRALWLAVAWLLIVGSRSVGDWLQLSSNVSIEGTGTSPIDAAVLSLLLAAGATVLLSRGGRVGTLLAANGPVVLYFLYCALSVIWSDYPIPSAKRWLRGAGDLVMVLVILTERNSTAGIQRVLTRAGIVLLPLSILLSKYFPDMGRAYTWDGRPMWTGVTLHKSSLGQTCLIFGLGSLWCFLLTYRDRGAAGRTRRLLAQGVIVLMAVWLLWLSDSKTSQLCFVLAGSAMLAVHLFSLVRRPAVLHAMLFVLLSAPILVLFLGVGKGAALEAMNRDTTLTGRTEIWDAMLRRVDNPLAGAGYEAFLMGPRRVAIIQDLGVFYGPHNGYLDTYLNLGWIGVGLILLLLAAAYRRTTALCRLHPDVGTVAVGYLIVAVVYNLAEAGFKMMSSVWIAFLLIALVKPRSAGTPAGRGSGAYGDPFRGVQPDSAARQFLATAPK